MKQVNARTCNYSSPSEFDSPCCRFGTGPRGGAVGDAVCAKAEQPKKHKSLTARGPLFLLAKFQRCFVCCEHCGSKISEPEAANNAGLLA